MHERQRGEPAAQSGRRLHRPVAGACCKRCQNCLHFESQPAHMQRVPICNQTLCRMLYLYVSTAKVPERPDSATMRRSPSELAQAARDLATSQHAALSPPFRQGPDAEAQRQQQQQQRLVKGAAAASADSMHDRHPLQHSDELQRARHTLGSAVLALEVQLASSSSPCCQWRCTPGAGFWRHSAWSPCPWCPCCRMPGQLRGTGTRS